MTAHPPPGPGQYPGNQGPYQQNPGQYSQAPGQYPPAPGQYSGGPVYYPGPPSGKSKVVAGILGILLGGFGVHNFYLGQTGKAVAQLLITVLSLGILSPVSALWGLIEGILILVSKPGDTWHRDAQGYELQD